MNNDPLIVSQALQDSMVFIARGSGMAARDSEFAVAAIFGLTQVVNHALPSSGNIVTGVAPDAKTVGIDGTDSGVALDDSHGASVLNAIFSSGFDAAFIVDDDFSTDEFNFVARSLQTQGCVLTPLDASTFDAAMDAIQSASVSLQGCMVKCRLGQDASHFTTSKVADLGQLFGVMFAILKHSTSIRATSAYVNVFAIGNQDFTSCFVNLRNATGSWAIGAPVTECVVGMGMLRAANDAGLLESLFEACGCRLNVNFDSYAPADSAVPDGINSVNMVATSWNANQEPYLYMRGWPTNVPSDLNRFDTNPSIVRHLSRRIPPMTNISRWTCYFPFWANESYLSTSVGASGQPATTDMVGMSVSSVNALADADAGYSFITDDPDFGGSPQNYAVNRWFLNGYSDEASQTLLPWSANEPCCFKYDVVRNIIDGGQDAGYASPRVVV